MAVPNHPTETADSSAAAAVAGREMPSKLTQFCHILQSEGVWVPDDASEEQVGISSVMQIVDHVYGQRQDQEHNPHGEHAHDVWQVMVPIPDEVYKGNARSSRE